jgi:hypothetical protein
MGVMLQRLRICCCPCGACMQRMLTSLAQDALQLDGIRIASLLLGAPLATGMNLTNLMREMSVTGLTLAVETVMRRCHLERHDLDIESDCAGRGDMQGQTLLPVGCLRL